MTQSAYYILIMAFSALSALIGIGNAWMNLRQKAQMAEMELKITQKLDDTYVRKEVCKIETYNIKERVDKLEQTLSSHPI